MYMSYCRFEGTRSEMNACFCDVEEHISAEAEYEVSEREIRHFQNMVRDMVSFLQDNELINEDGELDNEELERVCEAMRHGYEQEDEEE